MIAGRLPRRHGRGVRGWVLCGFMLANATLSSAKPVEKSHAPEKERALAPTATNLAAPVGPADSQRPPTLDFRVQTDVLRIFASAAKKAAQLGILKLPGRVLELLVLDSLVVATIEPRGVVVIDVQNPRHPQIVRHDPLLYVVRLESRPGYLILHLADGNTLRQRLSDLAAGFDAHVPESPLPANTAVDPAANVGIRDPPSPVQPSCGDGTVPPTEALQARVQDKTLLVRDTRNGCDVGSLKLPAAHRYLSRHRSLIVLSLEPRGLMLIDAIDPTQLRVVRSNPLLEIVAQKIERDTLFLLTLDGERIEQSLLPLMRSAPVNSPTAELSSAASENSGTPSDVSATGAVASRPVRGADSPVAKVQGWQQPRCSALGIPGVPTALSLVAEEDKLVVMDSAGSCWHGDVKLASKISDVLHYKDHAYLALRDGRIAVIELRQPQTPVVVFTLSTGCSLRKGMQVVGSEPTLYVATDPTGEAAQFSLRNAAQPVAITRNLAERCRDSVIRVPPIPLIRQPRPIGSSRGIAVLITGGIILPLAYISTVVPKLLTDAAGCALGSKSACKDNFFYIPVAGPWVDLAMQPSSEAFSIFSGLLQASGFGLLLIGGLVHSFSGSKSRRAWYIAPNVGGLAVSGRF